MSDTSRSAADDAKISDAARKPAEERLSQLSPEERLMWIRRHREGAKSLDKKERVERNRALRAKIGALSPEALAELKSELRGEWDALPPVRREALAKRLAAGD